MVAPGSDWPPLSGGAEAEPRNFIERVMNANHDAKRLLDYIQGHTGIRVPPPVLQYVKNMQALTLELVKNPWGADWKKDIDALRQETLQIKQDINTVRISTDPSQPQNRARSFADAVRQGCPPAPAHYLSAHGSDSSPGITRSELGEDREVVVRLGDDDAVRRFRGMTAKDIKRRAERVKVDAALRLGVPTLASVVFVAVRVLKSGDICFTLRSAKEAEIARTHQDGPKACANRQRFICRPGESSCTMLTCAPSASIRLRIYRTHSTISV